MLPLVSVVIPLYNRQATIQRAVDSVLDQTYSNIEVLVVDDGSTDNSVEILKKYENDDRVKVFYQKFNQGANAARNRGIKEARGEYIAFQDSDDEWLPDKLDKQIKKMVDENFYVTFCAFKRQYPKAIQTIPNISEKLLANNIREKLKTENIVGTPTLIIHKDVVQKVGIFDEEMPRLQDYEFIIRIAKKYDIYFINEVLVNEYQLDGCISLNQTSLHQAYALLIKKHADFLNIDYVWWKFLESGNEITDQSIDWGKLDETIENITETNKYCTRNALYKATIKHLNTKYSQIKKYEEHRFACLLSVLADTEFVVYGAGFFARQVSDILEQRNLFPSCFLVTAKDEIGAMNGIPVIQLSEWNRTDSIVIIAVSGKAQQQIIESLQNKGINQYFIYPGCV